MCSWYEWQRRLFKTSKYNLKEAVSSEKGRMVINYTGISLGRGGKGVLTMSLQPALASCLLLHRRWDGETVLGTLSSQVIERS